MKHITHRRGGHGVRSGALSIAFALALAAFAGGCNTQLPPPTVVKQASPNPLLGTKRYVVAVTWNGFTWDGQPEAAWLATRTPKQQESWAEDKVRITTKMLDWFNGGEKRADEQFTRGDLAGQGQFLLAINVDAFDGEFEWTLQVRDPNNNVVNEVRAPPNRMGRSNTWAAEAILCSVAPLTIMQYVRTRYGAAP